MKIHRLTSKIFLSFTLLHLLSNSTLEVKAQEVEGCFWINSLNQNMRIPTYMCGRLNSTIQNPAQILNNLSVEQVFIEDYKNLANSQEEPLVRSLLLSTIKNSPDGEVNEAKKFCAAFQSGKSYQDIIKSESEKLSQQDEGSATYRANLRLVSFRLVLATKHFCPQFASQINQ
ncbi:hypothetical protein NIES204_25320 [Planktothrix agardhii NIES-204]|jgi:hypothetical protein|nr:hypothetical protein NIES204_25320 [Planktothrix agardhii NIES-204]